MNGVFGKGLAWLCVLFLGSCAGPRQSVPPANSLFLYVSNQSFDRPNVDISVRIDGELVLLSNFEVEGQHNWIEYRWEIPAGDHELSVKSIGGDATLDQTINVEKSPCYAVLNYWCSDGQPPRFSYQQDYSPIGFM